MGSHSEQLNLRGIVAIVHGDPIVFSFPLVLG